MAHTTIPFKENTKLAKIIAANFIINNVLMANATHQNGKGILHCKKMRSAFCQVEARS